MKALPKKLRAALVRAGKTLTMLSEETGYSKAYFSLILNGRRRPTNMLLWKAVEHALGVPHQELYEALLEDLGNYEHARLAHKRQKEYLSEKAQLAEVKETLEEEITVKTTRRPRLHKTRG